MPRRDLLRKLSHGRHVHDPFEPMPGNRNPRLDGQARPTPRRRDDARRKQSSNRNERRTREIFTELFEFVENLFSHPRHLETSSYAKTVPQES
jgi:hypothetical protein